MSNPCCQIQDKIADSILGTLDQQQIDALNEHLEICPECRQYTEALRNISRQLVQLGQGLNEAIAARQDRVVDSLERSISGEHTRLYSIGRTITKSKITKFVAAAVVLVIALCLLFGEGQAALYARVMEALSNVRTVHFIAKGLEDGAWEKLTEVWYSESEGVVETYWRDNQINRVRIDNGEHTWLFSPDANSAKRSISIDPIGAVAGILESASLEGQARRERAYDKPVNGVTCLAYVRSNAANTLQTHIWLDENRLIRAWQKERLLEQGRWETYRTGHAQYNIELDPNLFIPNFGANVKIYEVDTVLDKHFGLDKAIFTRQALGLVFAVHDMRKCEGNIVYAVCSLRPTNETRREVRPCGLASWDYGTFHIGSAWRMADTSGGEYFYQPIYLAEIYHAGLQVRSMLLALKGSWPEEVEKCELEVHIGITGDALKERMAAKGLPCDERFNPIAVLALPKAKTNLEKTIAETYAVAKKLEQYVAYDKLTLKSVPFTDREMEDWVRKHPSDRVSQTYLADKTNRLSHGQATVPSKISKEDWAKDRMAYLAEVRAK
ncbi:MAG: anti-sigma factor family protein [Planctomycetota bacterium]|jgi:hypothetical protein